MEHLHAVDHVLAELEEIGFDGEDGQAAAVPGAGVVDEIPDHPLDGASVVDDALDVREVLLASGDGQLALEEPRGGEHHPEGITHVVAEDAEDPIAEVQRRAQLGFLLDSRADVGVHRHRPDDGVAEPDRRCAGVDDDVVSRRALPDDHVVRRRDESTRISTEVQHHAARARQPAVQRGLKFARGLRTELIDTQVENATADRRRAHGRDLDLRPCDGECQVVCPTQDRQASWGSRLK